ncbi:class I SAM-dependent methyltransferase [Geodermatophilus sp. URMC 65]
MPDGGPDAETWRQRRTSFGSVAAGYAAHRPDYPTDAVTFLVGERPRHVLDLGAGTGLLTGVLLAAGHEVVAVDPAEPMLAELRARYPQVATHVGDAEAVPLPDGSVDAVVAGRPRTGSTRNPRHCSCGGCCVPAAWSAWCGTPATRRSRGWPRSAGHWPPRRAGHEADQAVVDAFARALGARVEHHRSGTVQRLSPEQVVAGIATRSYVATMDDARRAQFLGEVRAVLDTHPGTRGRDLVDLPYRTDAYRLTPA